MQSTADFCHHIANTILKHADRVFGDATALHATIHLFDPHPTPRNLLISSLLFVRQTATARFFRRHDDFDPIQAKAYKPESCINRLPRGNRYRVSSAIRLSWTLPS